MKKCKYCGQDSVVQPEVSMNFRPALAAEWMEWQVLADVCTNPGCTRMELHIGYPGQFKDLFDTKLVTARD
jgi:hypothetical protein